MHARQLKQCLSKKALAKTSKHQIYTSSQIFIFQPHPYFQSLRLASRQAGICCAVGGDIYRGDRQKEIPVGSSVAARGDGEERRSLCVPNADPPC